MKLFVDAEQAASIIGVSVRHFRRYYENHNRNLKVLKFPMARTRHKFFFYRSEIEELKKHKERILYDESANDND